MTDFNQNVDQAKDLLNLEQKDMQKLPSMLNVLTILTYVGCAWSAITSIWGYFSAAMTYKMYENGGPANVNTDSKTLNSFISGASEIAKKQYDNRLMILVLGLLGVALCFYGALQMRNLKKQGYLFYIIGELLPIISFAAFIGFGNLIGAISVIFYLFFALLFIILYTTQRKALVN
jgi:hypothetical protein